LPVVLSHPETLAIAAVSGKNDSGDPCQQELKAETVAEVNPFL
jgi:hypothetical protein